MANTEWFWRNLKNQQSEEECPSRCSHMHAEFEGRMHDWISRNAVYSAKEVRESEKA